MIFFTSDLHLFHKNISKFQPNRDKDLDFMHECIVSTWNKAVSKTDTVYVLGDISFGKAEETRNILRRLNGNKVLVMGNHDRRSPQWYMDAGFKVVSTHDMTVEIGEEKYTLSHYPFRLNVLEYLWYRIFDPGYVRFQDRKLRDTGQRLLHGHNHGKHYHKMGRALDVGWDVFSRPVSEVEVQRLYSEAK